MDSDRAGAHEGWIERTAGVSREGETGREKEKDR